MIRTTLTAALAALVVSGVAAVSTATAADLDDRDYGQVRYEAPRHAGRIDDGRTYDRPRHRGEWDGPRGHRGYIGTIEARASYSGDYMPYHVTQWRARRSAIEAWKVKVENIYGPAFAHWRNAENQQVDCRPAGHSVYCIASARPVRGYARWGWYGRNRNE